MGKTKPNVVFIVLDTHRVDRLGCYGYKRGTSPNLDAFAQKSTVYTKAISPAQWTIPAHASMFCGEYPSTHNTIQANDALNKNFKTLAEFLVLDGYEAIGYCNNPLVGVLDNGLRRGFQEFYNYGGTIPYTPSSNEDNPQSIASKIRREYLKLIDRIAMPIQQAVAGSPDILQFALNPWLVPFWTRYSNFKGHTEASIQDTTNFLEDSIRSTKQDPQFIFLNLMETHLPYTPPRRFIQKYSPIVLEEPSAQDFIKVYNTKALQWLLPLETPYPDFESEILNNMYDAEVAYQDFLLNQLLEVLDRPEHQENTMVIIVGDHGEMLGEHQIMGHGLGVHEELVHVPLIIRFPEQTKNVQVQSTVSTTHIFHTILDQIGLEFLETAYGETIFPAQASLRNPETSPPYIFSEAYVPNNLILILEKYSPHLIEKFHCLATRWAVYNHPHKLIRTENVIDEIFNYHGDPKESNNLGTQNKHSTELISALEEFLNNSKHKNIEYAHSQAINMGDEKVMDRLRNLGYIE